MGVVVQDCNVMVRHSPVDRGELIECGSEYSRTDAFSVGRGQCMLFFVACGVPAVGFHLVPAEQRHVTRVRSEPSSESEMILLYSEKIARY